MLFLPLTVEVKSIFCEKSIKPNNREESEEETTDDNNEANAKLWSNENTLFLISEVERKQKEFETDIKKNVWGKVATACSKQFGKPVTLLQCDQKWKSLKRTYKSCILHNKTTGQKRKHWQYFSAINKFMHDKPEIEPIATCSSTSGLVINKAKQEVAEGQKENTEPDNSSESNEGTPVSSFSRKRQVRFSASDKRHKEKMARLDKFNTLFEKLIDKM